VTPAPRPPAPRGRLTPRQRTALAAAYTAVVFAACSLPGDALPDSPLLSADKLWHLGAFAVFAGLWRHAGRRAGPVLALGLAFGLAIEGWQHVAPLGRFFDPMDVLADAAGLLVGLGLYEGYRRGAGGNGR
jgi:hypothetical protein